MALQANGCLFQGTITPTNKSQAMKRDILDDLIDHAWRRFVKSVELRNKISNERMFKILEKIKGPEFVADLKKLRGNKTGSLIQLTKDPPSKAIEIKGDVGRYPSIPSIRITPKPTKDSMAAVCIQITHDRWIYFHY